MRLHAGCDRIEVFSIAKNRAYHCDSLQILSNVRFVLGVCKTKRFFNLTCKELSGRCFHVNMD